MSEHSLNFALNCYATSTH